MALPLAEVVPDDDYMPGPAPVGPVDFNVPPYVPPLLALVSCIVSGVTTFGDGIAFLVGWGILTTAGVLPAHAISYAKAVAYITLLPLTSLPALLWTARKELRGAAGYATVMSVTTAAFTPAGSYVLLFGAADAVSAVIGTFFIVFAAAKMQGSVVSLGKARKARLRAREVAAAAEAAKQGASGSAGGGGAAAPPADQLPAAAADAPPGAAKPAPPVVDVESGGGVVEPPAAKSSAPAPPSPPARQLSTEGALGGATGSDKRASLVLDQLRLMTAAAGSPPLHGGTVSRAAAAARSGADLDGALSLGPPAAVVASQQLGIHAGDSGDYSPRDDTGVSPTTTSSLSPESTDRGGADYGSRGVGFSGGGGGSSSSSTTFAPSEPGSGFGNTPILAAAASATHGPCSSGSAHMAHHTHHLQHTHLHTVHRPSPLATAHLAATAAAAATAPTDAVAPASGTSSSSADGSGRVAFAPAAVAAVAPPPAAAGAAAAAVDPYVRRLRIKLALGRAMGVSTPVLLASMAGAPGTPGGVCGGTDDGCASGGSSGHGSPTLAPLLLAAHRQRSVSSPLALPLSAGARSSGSPSPLSRDAVDRAGGAAAAAAAAAGAVGFAPSAASQQARPAASSSSGRGAAVAAALKRSGGGSGDSAPAPAAADGPNWGVVVKKGAHHHHSPAASKAPAPTCAARAAAAVDAAFPPVSATYSRAATGGILAATGVASGVLGGIIGSGGPPQMVAFAELKLRKDSIRGIKVLATTVANAVRLLTMAVAGNKIFRADEWPVYLGVAASSIVGTFAGSWLRDYVDGEAILRMLYVLLFVTAAIMFDALDSLPTGLGFLGGGLAWAGLIAVTYLRPHEVAAAQAAVTRALRAALCCSCLRRTALPQSTSASPAAAAGGATARGKAAK